jgi:hypothetical protein
MIHKNMILKKNQNILDLSNPQFILSSLVVVKISIKVASVYYRDVY